MTAHIVNRVENVTYIADNEATHPPKDRWVTVLMMGSIHLIDIQYDEKSKRWFDNKNHAVDINKLGYWQRIVPPAPPLFICPTIPDALKKSNLETVDSLYHAKLPSLGYFDWMAQEDQYKNKVTIIHLGQWMDQSVACEPKLTYRMVHHASKNPNSARKYATIYAGRGKFVKVNIYHSNNDTHTHTCKVGEYETSWGDGDNLGVSDNFPAEYKEEAQRITEDADEAFILYVLYRFAHTEGFWQTKEVIKKEDKPAEQAA